jgi:hypothetical protein
MGVSCDITCWAVVPLACITTEADASVDTPFRTLDNFLDAFAKKDARLGTLTRYNSSPGVHRYFCSVCSASIFVTHGKASDPGTIDVAVGVLHHPDGARAEGLLAWKYSEIDFAADGAGGWREELNRQALEEVQRWRSDVKSS